MLSKFKQRRKERLERKLNYFESKRAAYRKICEGFKQVAKTIDDAGVEVHIDRLTIVYRKLEVYYADKYYRVLEKMIRAGLN